MRLAKHALSLVSLICAACLFIGRRGMPSVTSYVSYAVGSSFVSQRSLMLRDHPRYRISTSRISQWWPVPATHDNDGVDLLFLAHQLLM